MGDTKQILDEETQILDTLVQNFEATTTWRMGFVHTGL